MELEEILNSEGLKKQHHVGQVGSLDLRDCGLQHLRVVRRLGVQSITLPVSGQSFIISGTDDIR